MKPILLLLVIAIASCANRPSDETMLASEKSTTLTAFDASAQQSTTVVIERKLIRNGDLSFETSDVKKTKAIIESICKDLNAYISNESQNHFEERLQYNQVIRVPAEKFDSLIQKIETLASMVESKNINTQDVTEKFIDVEARLKTKKELENRYRDILKQAKTVADIVAVESQIATVRSEIESMEGRLNYLKNQVGYSTLNVSFYEHAGTDFGFGSKFLRALSQGWDNLLSFLIAMVNLWPFFLLAAGITWVLARLRARKK